MKRLLIATVTLAAIAAAAPAMAQTSHTTTINANVPAVCTVTPATSTINVGTMTANASGAVNVTGPTAGFETLASGFCNGVNSTISVSATPLQNAATVSASQAADFTNRVDFSFTFKVDGVTVPGAVNTAGAGTGINNAVVGLFNGDLGTNQDLLPANIGAGRQLVAGAYVGTISFTVTPAA